MDLDSATRHRLKAIEFYTAAKMVNEKRVDLIRCFPLLVIELMEDIKRVRYSDPEIVKQCNKVVKWIRETYL